MNKSRNRTEFSEDLHEPSQQTGRCYAKDEKPLLR